MRDRADGPIVIDLRHKSCASAKAPDLLKIYALGWVLADPAPTWPVENFDRRPRYMRLHGEPKIDYLRYTDYEITALSLLTPDCGCFFDDSASRAAIKNADDA